MTYQEAEYLFSKARNKRTGKFLQKNTHLIKLENDDYAILFHRTEVVTIHQNGTYTLQTEGYKTKTTKERINQYSPTSIYQKDYIWYLSDNTEFYDGVWCLSKNTEFYNGMKIR